MSFDDAKDLVGMDGGLMDGESFSSLLNRQIELLYTVSSASGWSESQVMRHGEVLKTRAVLSARLPAYTMLDDR